MRVSRCTKVYILLSFFLSKWTYWLGWYCHGQNLEWKIWWGNMINHIATCLRLVAFFPSIAHDSTRISTPLAQVPKLGFTTFTSQVRWKMTWSLISTNFPEVCFFFGMVKGWDDWDGPSRTEKNTDQHVPQGSINILMTLARPKVQTFRETLKEDTFEVPKIKLMLLYSSCP